ncbi:MAG: gliding motility-associated ABC transporter substrate-binding protein GldG [Bacteroidia bacterium]
MINKVTKGKISATFLLFVAGLVVVNLLADVAYYRFDLTKEKRYTLAPSTKKLLEKVDDVAFFTIYLDGDIPANYKRLKEATRDMLNEFRLLAGPNIEFEFEDVLKDKEIKEKDEILKQFASKGIEISRPDTKADEAPTDKYIIPGGMVFYKGQEYPLNLLKKKFGNSTEMDVNESIELLEYEIGNIIRKCVAGKEVKIALINGHGELGDMDVADIATELGDYYKVSRFNLNINDTACLKQVGKAVLDSGERGGPVLIKKLIEKLNTYKGIIIAKPIYRFKDIEKFIIDQYVMNGGKVIWLVESLNAEMDSVGKFGNIYTYDYDLNINDLLFRYGVRVNFDLVQDIQCHGIPVMLKGGGGKPDFKPWIFYPLVNPADSTHPIVKNMSSVWTQFTSSIDTTTNPNIKKTVLLHSSPYSRTAGNPVNISLDILGIQPNPAVFNKPYRPVAMLLEGVFKSQYEHVSGIKQNIPFKNKIDKNSMIVISDGDVIRNQVKQGTGEIYPLGFDRFASQAFGEPVIFANKTFILNCVDYLCDETNLIEVRTKDVELRLMDTKRIATEKMNWQLINMVGPIGAVLIFGFVNAWWRRRKYAR